MRFVFLFAMLLPMTALAQINDLPQLYRVDGVAAADRLNIRVQPNAAAPILGSLAMDAKNIEVVAKDDTLGWFLVNSGEASGWVSAKFMKPQATSWQQGKLPQNLRCFGTEPFWDMDFRNNTLTLAGPENPTQSLPIDFVKDRNFEHDRIRVVKAGDLISTISAKSCSDGMSDRAFGLEIITIQTGAEQNLWVGCCSIAPR